MLVLLSFSPILELGRCLYTLFFWLALYVEAVNDDRYYFEKYDSYKEYLKLVPDIFFNFDFLFGSKKRKIEEIKTKEKEEDKKENESDNKRRRKNNKKKQD